MSKEVVAIDSQRLNTLQNCAYKFELVFNRDLVPVQQSEPIEQGDLIHKMLQEYYTLRGIRERQGRPRIPIDEITRICERIAERHAITLSIPNAEIEDTFRVFSEYIYYYWNEPHETIKVEDVGSKVLYEDDELAIVYEAKIDWICSIANCNRLPVDHKSYRSKRNILDLNNQFMGYCWMLDVRNIMINRIGFQTTVAPKDKFVRPILSYSKPMLDNWVRNTIWWVKQLMRYEKEGVWPQNFTSCDKYSGCIFIPVCSCAPENHNEKLISLFDIKETKWDIGASL